MKNFRVMYYESEEDALPVTSDMKAHDIKQVQKDFEQSFPDKQILLIERLEND